MTFSAASLTFRSMRGRSMIQREQVQRERTAERDRIVRNPRSYKSEIGLNYTGTIVPSVAQAVFIYVMCDPRPNHNSVYIGQTGDDVFSRMYRHLSAALSITIRHGGVQYKYYSPVNRWLRELHKCDLRPVMCVLDVVSQRFANQIEKSWIKIIAVKFEEDCLNCTHRCSGRTREPRGKLKKGRWRELPSLPPIVLTSVHPAFYEEVEEPIVYCPNALEKGST